MSTFLLKKNIKGFSLVEMLIYIAILVMMLMVIINMLYIISSSGRRLTSSRNIENSGAILFERITREIRNSTSVDSANSTFDTSPGVLVLNQTDLNSNAHSVKFIISSNTVHVLDNGTDQGPLTGIDTKVTNLVFSRITSTSSQAIRIQVTLQSGTSTAYKSKNFYSTTILRGSL